jgi:hypothetical protein
VIAGAMRGGLEEALDATGLIRHAAQLSRRAARIERDRLLLPHSQLSFPAKAGNPVRRGFSIQSQPPLEYWIARFRGR